METPYINKSGLTSYGEQLLLEMQALDLILDVSHMAGPLLAEVLRKYSGKIIASHVVLRNILKSKCPRSNSLSKEELLALANRSALIGVPFVNDLVDPYGAQPDGTYTGRLLDLLKQIKAITDVVGVENVAIGPDFFNFSYYSRRLNLTLRPIENLDTNSGLRRLESELLKSGFSENDIDRIMFLNAELFFKNHILNN
jgi:microsomal dipeptidase-like Zn-dependent dipeptidase